MIPVIPMRTQALMSVVALGYLVVMYVSGAPPTHENRVTAEVEGVLELDPERIVAVDLTHDGMNLTFRHRDGRWWDGTTGDRLAKSRAQLLQRAITFMHTAAPVRILPPEAIAAVTEETYGLDRRSLKVRLSGAGGLVLAAGFGRRANDGILQYMRMEGRGEIYLMSGFVGEAWNRLATREASPPGP